MKKIRTAISPTTTRTGCPHGLAAKWMWWPLDTKTSVLPVTLKFGAFEQELLRLKIRQHLIKPGTPELNGLTPHKKFYRKRSTKLAASLSPMCPGSKFLERL